MGARVRLSLWSAGSLEEARSAHWSPADTSSPSPVRLALVVEDGEGEAALSERAAHVLTPQGPRELRGENGAWFTEQPVGPGQLAALFPSEGIRAAPSVARLVRDSAAAARGCWDSMVAAGIQPTLAAGHSAGELAAVVALRLMALDAERFVELGSAVDAGDGPWTLLSVLGAARVAVEATLHAVPSLCLCADDSPRHQLLGGDAASVQQAARALASTGALCRELPWPIAAHTPYFRRTADAIGALLDTATPSRPEACLYSSAGARPFPWEDPAETRSLLLAQWVSPVRFRETTEALYAAGARAFIELPGRQGLAGYVTDTLGNRPHLAVSLGTAAPLDLAKLAAQLWVHHLPVDVSRWTAGPLE